MSIDNPGFGDSTFNTDQQTPQSETEQNLSIDDMALGILAAQSDPMPVDTLHNLLTKSNPDLSKETFDQMIQAQVSEGKVIYLEDQAISLSSEEENQNTQRKTKEGGTKYSNGLAEELITGMQKPASRKELKLFIKKVANGEASLDSLVQDLVSENKISPEFGQNYFNVPEVQESSMSDQDYVNNIFNYLIKPISRKDLITFVTETRPQISEQSVDQMLIEMIDNSRLTMQENNKVTISDDIRSEIESNPEMMKTVSKIINSAIWG